MMRPDRRVGRLRPQLLPRFETCVMGAAVVALIVLVVLPLLFLLVGSIRGEEGLSLEHFTEALSGRLYLQALVNSLVLGAWTGLFSVVIGLPMAWAVSRTNVPFPALFRVTATLSYLSPPFLTAIAYVNHGRWVADCPTQSCPGAVALLPGVAFLCDSCLNVDCGHRYRPVAWPAHRGRIEEILIERMLLEEANWIPSETVDDLEADDALHMSGGN